MDFEPLWPNAHVLTILSNFWPRHYDFSAFPVTSRMVGTAPDVQVRVDSQSPAQPVARMVTLHGLEGSGDSGYIVSLAHLALESGIAVERFHMRTCGGTEHLCTTLYHAGLTADLLAFLEGMRSPEPVFLAGFSLGGNVALKAACEAAPGLVAGVVSVAAPIDLAAAADALERPSNFVYAQQLVRRMKQRLLRTGRYRREELAELASIRAIDEKITAPGFGFGNAANYYRTQSARQYLDRLTCPALLIAAQDDPLVPFAMYEHPAVRDNARITLLAPQHGGHLGFLSRRPPRFWVDRRVVEFVVAEIAPSSLANPATGVRSGYLYD